MKSTKPSGELIDIEDCYIATPFGTVTMRVLPDIANAKSATYADEPVIGRSTPIKTYSHSDNRSVTWKAHFVACKDGDLEQNLANLRALEACCYPRDGGGNAPYTPPPVCRIRCGRLLADTELCAVMKSCNWSVPTDAVWDDESYLPYRFEVDMAFDIVYDSGNLPGAEKIFRSGG